MEAAIDIDHELGSFNSSKHICRTEILDIGIEDARYKKKIADSKMDSIMSLLEEVECTEIVAKKAKEEVDRWSLDNLAEMEKLKLLQQHAKKTNDMRAREVYAQKDALATELENLQLRVSKVLNEGDESMDVLDELRKSLEERLSSAKLKKEVAEKEKLEKEMALAYQKREMEKVIEESKNLEQQAKENWKLQKFLQHRGHVVDILQHEISSKCDDVKLLKEGLEVNQDGNKFLDAENTSTPIIQELTQLEAYESKKFNNLIKGVKGRATFSKKETKVNKMCKSPMKYSMNKATSKWIEEHITESVTDYQDNHLAMEGRFYIF